MLRILFFTIFTILLIGLRIYLTSNIFYAMLLWNVTLAWVPYILSSTLQKKNLAFLYALPIVLLWLFFYPNSAYLVVDFLHLTPHTDVLGNTTTFWMDIFLLFFTGLLGIVLGVKSMDHMEYWAKTHLNMQHWLVSILQFLIFLLTGFGIYIGRFIRFNSWDIVLDPFSVLKKIYSEIALYLDDPNFFVYIIILGTGLWVSYLMLKETHIPQEKINK